MANYTKITDYAAKDALITGNPAKLVKSTEIGADFDAVAVAIATKADSADPTFTGVASFPDGSAAAPSITNTGDVNTGIFFPAADTVAVSTGGSERMLIGTNGNVRVGGSGVSPAEKLTVNDGNFQVSAYNGTTTLNAAQLTISTGAPTDGVTITNSYYGSGGYGPTKFEVGGAERMRIDASGNVGIGAAPTSLFSSNRFVQVTGTSGKSACEVYLNDGADNNRIEMFVNDTTGTLGINTGSSSGIYSGLSFNIEGSQKMLIDRSGNVGIGKTPSANRRLDVKAENNNGTTYGLIVENSSGSALLAVLDTGLATFNQPAGFGYGTGAGGMVTQATSKSTTVTLNKPTGQITMNNATLNSGATVSFQVLNSLVAASDIVLLTHTSAGAHTSYNIWPYAASGSFYIAVQNISGSNLSDALVINFAIIKGATS